MTVFSSKFALGSLLIFVLISSDLFAVQLYRYKDESGNTVLNSTIPPSLVGNGYDILNEKGRLIERVAPALTPEQIAARDAELERQKREAEANARQEEADNQLRQLYSHPNDAVRILKRKSQDIKGVIQVKQGQIESAEKQILEEEAKAANMQRNGIAVPENLLTKIANLKKDIENAEIDIAELNKEHKKVLGQFDEKIKRLEVITGKKATDYTELLKALEDKSAKPEGGV